MRRPRHGLLETQTKVNGGGCSPNISLIAAATASGVGSSLRAGCASFRPATSCDNPAELWKPAHAASATASSDEDTKAAASCLNLQHLTVRSLQLLCSRRRAAILARSHTCAKDLAACLAISVLLHPGQTAAPSSLARQQAYCLQGTDFCCLGGYKVDRSSSDGEVLQEVAKRHWKAVRKCSSRHLGAVIPQLACHSNRHGQFRPDAGTRHGSGWCQQLHRRLDVLLVAERHQHTKSGILAVDPAAQLSAWRPDLFHAVHAVGRCNQCSHMAPSESVGGAFQPAGSGSAANLMTTQAFECRHETLSSQSDAIQ